MQWRRGWLLGCIALVLFGVGCVLALLLSPRGIRIVLTPSQLQVACDHVFPVSKRYFDLIELTYHDPDVSINAADDRVRLAVPLTVAIAGHTLHGMVRGSACLRYDAIAAAIFLDRLLLEQATIDEVSPTLLERIRPYASQLLAQHLETHPIHVLQGSIGQDLEHLVIREVHVTRGNLILTLGR